MYSMGVCYRFGAAVKKDVHKAVQLLSQASDMGHAEAMYVLGGMLIDGCEGCEAEPFRASKLFIEGEKMNHMGCRYRLALCYWHGRAVSEATDIVQSYERAAKLLNSNTSLNSRVSRLIT